MRQPVGPESYDVVPGFPKRVRANQARVIAELTLPGDVTVCVLVFCGRSWTNRAAVDAWACSEHCGQCDFGAAL